MDIVIRYNSIRGFEDAALDLARRLFARFDESIDSLALVPVANEDLALELNGQLIHSLRQSGRAPLVADVLAALGSAAAKPHHQSTPRPEG